MTETDPQMEHHSAPIRGRRWLILNAAKILFKIALPIFDMVTDVYTLTQYYNPSKPLMMKVFMASLLTILLHNCISTFYWMTSISKFHERLPLFIWSNSAWRGVTIMLHAFGLGGILVPIEAACSIWRLNRDEVTQRFARAYDEL